MTFCSLPRWMENCGTSKPASMPRSSCQTSCPKRLRENISQVRIATASSRSSRPSSFSSLIACGSVLMPTPSSRMPSACSCTSESRPRAGSISAVVSPPTPAPTMIAFMNAYARNHSRLSARDAAHHFMLRCARDTDSAWPGTGDQPPICHTVSGLYGAAPGAVNANNSRAKAGIRMTQLTLFDKIWAQHEILKAENGNSLLWIDRHYIHEGSFQGFDKGEARGEKVSRPDLTFGIADHYVPTSHGRVFNDPSLKHMVEQLVDNTKKHGIML